MFPILFKLFFSSYSYQTYYYKYFLLFVSGFITSRNIVDYSSNKKSMIEKCKTASFKNAVDRIEEYITNPIVGLEKVYSFWKAL